MFENARAYLVLHSVESGANCIRASISSSLWKGKKQKQFRDTNKIMTKHIRFFFFTWIHQTLIITALNNHNPFAHGQGRGVTTTTTIYDVVFIITEKKKSTSLCLFDLLVLNVTVFSISRKQNVFILVTIFRPPRPNMV